MPLEIYKLTKSYAKILDFMIAIFTGILLIESQDPLCSGPLKILFLKLAAGAQSLFCCKSH